MSYEWIIFKKEFWGKKAKVIDFGTKDPLANSEEVFKILLTASEKYRNLGKFSDLKMYLNGRQLVQELKLYLPSMLDKDFGQYIQRLDQLTNSSEFIIYVNNFQIYNWPLYVSIKRFISGFLQEMNITPSSIEVELFAGRYAKTPGGIHKDGCTNLHFVISGTKIFYIWPSHLTPYKEMVVKQKYSGQEEYLDSADIGWESSERIDFTAKQGELIYCPYNWWHIGNSPQFCVCLNIAVYTEDLTTSFIETSIERLTSTLNTHLNNSGVSTLDDKLEYILEKLASNIKSGQINELIKLDKLKKATSHGLLPPPKTDQIHPLTDHIMLTYDPSSNLAYCILQDYIVYSANGHNESLPYELAYIELLEIIKALHKFAIRDLKNECLKLLKEVAATAVFENERDNIICNLINMRAIYIIPN